MADTIDSLWQRMEAAARALDFEEAQKLRDRISLMRGGATAAEAELADDAGLICQRPGAMGLGTSRQRANPPNDWTPPPKPEPLTRGTKRRGR